MSGHSKWSTIKHKKETTDARRGKLFSTLSRGIIIAIKTGGGPNPETNYKLRVAIDTAKAANMPKGNIDRVLAKAQSSGDMFEARYEGFTAGGASVLVDVVTDNKNRSAQEIKSIFEKGRGQFASPGAVSFNFEPKGLLLVEKKGDVEEQMLEMIDTGIEDLEEANGGIECYVPSETLHGVKGKLEEKGYAITSADLVQKPKTLHTVDDSSLARVALLLLSTLEDHEDVQNVFTNINISDGIVKES